MNEAIVSENADKISEALEKLKNTSMEIGKSIYSQANNESSSTQEEEQKPEGVVRHKAEQKFHAKFDESKNCTLMGGAPV